MLKFFRNLRRNLVNSGDGTELVTKKFKKPVTAQIKRYIVYATGEILLVMVGILLALQVNNWNQDRIISKTERSLLNEIHKEFQYNQEELQSTVRDYKRLEKSCTTMLDAFPIDPQKLNKDSMAFFLWRLRLLSTADLSMGSISTLINTSSFDIITDGELRSLLIQWEDLISDYFERELQAITNTRDHIIPYLAKRVPQPYKKGLVDPRVNLAFLNSIEFQNLIHDRLNDTRTLLKVVQSEDSKIKQALNRIILLSDNSAL